MKSSNAVAKLLVLLVVTVDALNLGTKFSVPTIANGYVYVGTPGYFNVFGLITGKICTS